MLALATKTRLIALIAAMGVAAGAILLTGCSGGNKAGGTPPTKAIVLTMASEISGGQPVQLERFADEVARRSHGTLRIAFQSNWRAGDLRQQRDTIADVRSGKVDLAWVGARAWDWLGVNDFDALLAPFLIDSYALEKDVFARGIPEQMLAGVGHTGVVPLGILPGPLRKLLGVRRPFMQTSDFEGAVVGVNGLIAAETVRALGGRPRQIFAQTSLRGLDALEQQLGSIEGNQYDTTARYLDAQLDFWPRPIVIFAAPKVFRSLTRAQQAVLREAAAASGHGAIAALKREDADASAVLCRRGRLTFVVSTPSQLDAFRRAVAPVYRRLEHNVRTRTFLLEIEALKRRVTPEPPPHCVGSRISSARQGVSPIDGLWEMRVSRDYMIRHHLSYLPPPTEEDLRLDSGWYRLSLHQGRVSAWHRAPAEHTYSTGELTVSGGTIVFRFTGGHEAGQPTQKYRYRWSLYRNMLTLRPVGGAVANFGFAPWRRVGR